MTRTVRRPRLRLLDALVAAVFLFGVSVSLAARPPSARAQADPGISVRVSWSDAVEKQFVAWTNAFYGAESRVDFAGQGLPGEQAAKEAVIDGRFGFTVSGSPLSAEEQAEAAALGKEIVAVPITATGLVLGVRGPYPTGWQVLAEDPPGSENYVNQPFTPEMAPLRFRPSVVYRMFANPIVRLLTDADFNRDLAPYSLAVGNTSTATGVVVRSDPGALNLQLQRYIRHFELTRWQTRLTAVGESPDYLGAEWPVKTAASRSGRAAMSTAIAGNTNPESGSTAVNGNVGIFTLADWAVTKELNPDVDLRAAQIQNASGAWVDPTPESVLAGIEAGMTEFGFVESAGLLDNTAVDAYPMTWLNYMLIPTEGLEPGELNAIANLARYAVTGGQAVQASVGEPALPNALVQQSLAAVDDLVQSNCTAAGSTVRTDTDPGPAAPPKADFVGIDSFVLCDVPKPPPTTTATPSTTTTTVSASDGSTLAPSSANGTTRRTTTRRSTPRPPATTVAPTGEAPTPTTIAVQDDETAETEVLGAVQLPLGDPVSDPQQHDRLATMAVGGSLAYGALRRLFLRAS